MDRNKGLPADFEKVLILQFQIINDRLILILRQVRKEAHNLALQQGKHEQPPEEVGILLLIV